MEVGLPTRRKTRRLGALIARSLAPGDVVLLEGELGAGKTFLTRAIARGLGVPREVRITSPTFALVNEYPRGEGTLLHVDLYRLRGPMLEEEVTRLGLRERIVDGDILIAEWAKEAERAIGITPCLFVTLRTRESGGRSATLSGDLLRTLGPMIEHEQEKDDLLGRAHAL